MCAVSELSLMFILLRGRLTRQGTSICSLHDANIFRVSSYYYIGIFVNIIKLIFFIRVHVPPRKGSKRIQLKGIFVGAKVVRGPDWEWGQQDGGEGKYIYRTCFSKA